MALLAEQLVDEWLNRQGFFTLRGVRAGTGEIDLLGVRQSDGALEGWHVEVQVSFRPVSYLGRLSRAQQAELDAKSSSSAKKRPEHILKTGIEAWVDKKFRSEAKQQMRKRAWPAGLHWKEKLVHGEVRERHELDLIQGHGIETVPFSTVLSALCAPSDTELFGAAGTDIAEMISFYRHHSDSPPEALPRRRPKYGRTGHQS